MGKASGTKAPETDAADAGAGTERRIVNLALQGGGTHGAFTWGVLDRLLEDERIVIEGISGTSAGAMNGAVLVQGFCTGGAKGARAALDRFWRRLSEVGWASPVQRTWYQRMLGEWNIDATPAAMWFDQASRLFSPYQTNPLNLSPLRDVLSEQLDMATLRAADTIKLFVSATNAHNGKIRIFERPELTVDMLLASACLPQVFQSIVIEGDAYWDGGYMGNPAIFPLIYNCKSPDVVIVQVNPLKRSGVPRTALEISNRLNEITFNASLIREMRAIAFVDHLIDEREAHGPGIDRLKRMHIHLVEAERAMERLGVASKLNTEIDFLLYLRDLGRRTCSRWLHSHFDALGQRSSIDIAKMFL
jgi:NTE family protein